MLIEKKKETESILKYKKIVNFVTKNDKKIECYGVIINR